MGIFKISVDGKHTRRKAPLPVRMVGKRRLRYRQILRIHPGQTLSGRHLSQVKEHYIVINAKSL